MKSSIVFRRCVMLLDVLKQEGYENEISVPELKKRIAQHVGGDKRTVRAYLDHLQNYGMIVPTVKPNILRVNHDYAGQERKLLKNVVAGRLSGFLEAGE